MKTTNTDSVPSPPARSNDFLGEHRLRGLDGLRAIAVLFVIAFHLTPGAFDGGYLGVDVFFVISGFLITTLLLAERRSSGGIRLGTFWMRRARRLLPAIALLVIVCCAVALAIGGDVLLGLGGQVLAAATFSSNWLFIAEGASYFDDSAPELFRNLWSLAIEEQFYLVWPLLVLVLAVIRARRLRLVILVVLALSSAAAMAIMFVPGTDSTRVYYGTDTHIFGLAIGATLAVVAESWPSSRLGWSRMSRFTVPVFGFAALAGVGVLGVALGADGALAFRGGLVLASILTAITIAGAVVPGSWLGAALDSQPLKWIGERSYGLYLWHWPVLVLIAAAFPALDSTAAGAWWLAGVTAAVTVVAAALSFRFVEQPIRQRGFRSVGRSVLVQFRSGPLAISRTVVAALAVIGCTVFASIAVASDPGHSELEAQLSQGRTSIERTLPAEASSEPRAPAGGDQIAAIGDSVMLAAAPELQAALPGILIDATVSRQMRAAPDAVRALIDAGNLRPVLIIGLGTNGWISPDTLDEVRALVGPSTEIVLVNVQAPRDWVPDVNGILARYAQQNRTVELANWHDAIQPNLNELASDEVHPGGPISGGIYVAAIQNALQRLAELPPILDNNDYGLAPRPA